jgi:outer membrane protein OmpA-like peptidoglycan-associated protein
MRTAKYILILIAYFTLNSVYLFSQTSINHIESVKEIKAINTKGEESNPIIAPGGNKMYFMHMSSNKKKASILGQEIWTSEKIEGEWSNATPWQISSNDNANNVIIGVTNNEKRLYLFNSNDTRNKFAKGLSYVQLNEGGVFDSPIGTSIPEFEIAYGFYSFYVTPDEEQFFVATTADSSDYEDLFVSLKQEDGSWGELINLGSTINTSFIETTPFLSADKKVLYFSSDGHDGFGSADLFKSERIGDGWTNWTPPENLGENINSKGFDASYVVLDEWTAMFSSNRNRTFSDIYEVTFARENQTIALIVSADTNILEGRISLAKLDTTSTAPIKLLVKDHLGVVVDTIYADYKGKFTYKKLTASKYTISLMDGNDSEMIDISIADLLASSEAAIPSTESTIKLVEANNVGAATDKLESSLPKSMETVRDSFRDIYEGTFVLKNQAIALILSSDTNILEGRISLAKLDTTSIAPIKLLVKDHLGVVVDTIYADYKGKFTYKKLTASKYTISLMDGNDSEMIDISIADLLASSEAAIPSTESTIKLVEANNVGAATDKLESSLPKSMETVRDSFRDIYEGTFVLKNQAIALILSSDTNILEGRISLAKLDTTSIAPIKLLVKDHLGVVVDTIYADYKGKFTYKKLTTSKYTISLMDGNDTEMIDISIADLLASSEAAITSTEPTVKAVEAYKVEAAADKSESPLLKSMETVCDSLSKGSIVQQISKRLETQGNSVDLKEAASLSRIEGNSSEDLEEECLELLVYFDFDSYSISDIGIHQIDKYIEGLELVKGSILIITGHTDSDGPSAYNNILGERRANAVKEHFIQKGIIVNYDVTSKGEEEPMALNSTEQGRKSNRRVSVTISKNGTKKIPA